MNIGGGKVFGGGGMGFIISLNFLECHIAKKAV
jgi:hypothetical protein